MIQAVMTAAADGAALRYRMFVDSLRAIHERVLTTPSVSIAAAGEEAKSLAQAFYDDEAQRHDDMLAQIVREARQTTLRSLSSIETQVVSVEAGELLSESQDYLAEELGFQLQRDIANLQRSLRTSRAALGRSARSRGVSLRSAIVEHQIASKAEPDFFVFDRAARKWSSHKVVRSLVRHTALNLYNETVLSALADHGVTQAIISHANVASASHGRVVSLHPAGEHPTYSELRNDVFHPNSDAILTAGDF